MCEILGYRISFGLCNGDSITAMLRPGRHDEGQVDFQEQCRAFIKDFSSKVDQRINAGEKLIGPNWQLERTSLIHLSDVRSISSISGMTISGSNLIIHLAMDPNPIVLSMTDTNVWILQSVLELRGIPVKKLNHMKAQGKGNQLVFIDTNYEVEHSWKFYAIGLLLLPTIAFYYLSNSFLIAAIFFVAGLVAGSMAIWKIRNEQGTLSVFEDRIEYESRLGNKLNSISISDMNSVAFRLVHHFYFGDYTCDSSHIGITDKQGNEINFKSSNHVFGYQFLVRYLSHPIASRLREELAGSGQVQWTDGFVVGNESLQDELGQEILLSQIETNGTEFVHVSPTTFGHEYQYEGYASTHLVASGLHKFNIATSAPNYFAGAIVFEECLEQLRSEPVDAMSQSAQVVSLVESLRSDPC